MLVALSFERGVVGGVRDAARLLTVAEEHLASASGDDGAPRLDDSALRHELARLTIDCEVADLLASRAVWVAATGQLPGVEGAATKLFATEALNRAAGRLLDAEGPAGLVQSHDVGDLSAFYEYCYRFAPVTTIYGGTSEIQRNLIAQRGLGLPRSR
jgi:alkylation response protein AidB-like acyl-CoA dehydrogenase